MGYYLRPCSRTTTPRRLVSIVIGTRKSPETDGPQGQYRLVFDRAYIAYSARSRNGWSARHEIECGTPEGVWQWLENGPLSGRRVHCIAPIASDCLTLLGLWDRLDAMGACFHATSSASVLDAGGHTASPAYAVRSLIARGTTDIIRYCQGWSDVTWLSLRQILPLDDQQIASMAGHRWSGSPSGERDYGYHTYDARDRARLYLAGVQALCEWWRAIGGGPWGNTIGQLSYRYLLSRVRTRSVCVHRHAEALRLERVACHGGRSSCLYRGTVGVPSAVPD